MLTHNRFQRALGANGHSGHELNLLDTFGSPAPLAPHQPPSLRPPPPRPLRLQLTLTALLYHHSHPPPTPPPPSPLHPPPPPLLCCLPSWRLPRTSTRHTILAHPQTSTPPPSTPEVRTRAKPALTESAPFHHSSTWSVICESIAQRLTNQCLEDQPTPTVLASTLDAALALLRIAWAYSVTCASTRAELTAVPTHPPRPDPPSPRRPVRPPPPPSPPQPLRPTPTPPTSHAHAVHTHSPHTSAWSVTCGFIAQRLMNQCLEDQPTPTVLASTLDTALSLPRIAWAYSTTCAFKKTCGRQPPAAPHHHTLPPSPHHPITHQQSPTASTQLPAPTKVGTEAVISPENEQKASPKWPFEIHGSRDIKSVSTAAANDKVAEVPNQLSATNQSTGGTAQPLANGQSADARTSPGRDNSPGVIFPERQGSFESLITTSRESDRVSYSVQQERQHQPQEALQQVRSSSPDTFLLEIDSKEQVRENEKTPTRTFKAHRIHANWSPSQKFAETIASSGFIQCTRRVSYDDSMCFISCRRRRAAPQNDFHPLSKAKRVGEDGKPPTDYITGLFSHPHVRSAESICPPLGSDASEQPTKSKKKRHRTLSDLFKSLRRKQKPKKGESEEKLGSTIGALAAISAGMIHSGSHVVSESAKEKTDTEKSAERQVLLKPTCLQAEMKTQMPLNQTLFVVTSPTTEYPTMTSQVSSASVHRKARTDSGILSNYSLSSTEAVEFCVSPTLSSRSVNSSSFSSPKLEISECTTGKSSLVYPTQSGNSLLETGARPAVSKLHSYLLTTNGMTPVCPLETTSSFQGNTADLLKSSVTQLQRPLAVRDGLQETHFPHSANETDFAGNDWDQACVVQLDPSRISTHLSLGGVVKTGLLPEDITSSSSCTSNKELPGSTMIIPVREKQQFQAAAAAVFPTTSDSGPETSLDSDEKINSSFSGVQLSSFQAPNNLPVRQVTGQKSSGALDEEKVPCIMNPDSHTSITPDSDDEQTLDEISDRELIEDRGSCHGNKSAKRGPEGINTDNSPGGACTMGTILKGPQCPLTFVKPPEDLGDGGLPIATQNPVTLSTCQALQGMAKNCINADWTNAQPLDPTRTGVVEPSDVQRPGLESSCREQIRPATSSVRDVQVEETLCSRPTTHLKSSICPQPTSSLLEEAATDKSISSSSHSNDQSTEQSLSMTISDQPTEIPRTASEYDLQTATLYFMEHQRQPTDLAINGGIANATFPRRTAGRFFSILRPSPKILRLVESAFESYERFPSPGLPYFEEQSRVDEKGFILRHNSRDSADFEEDRLRQTGELSKPSRWLSLSNHLPHLLVDVVNLSTAYIPRYLSCVYDWPRTAMHDPDRSLEMLFRSTQNFLFNNPVGIAGVFLCTTLAAPHLQQIPFVLANFLSPQALTEAVTAVTRQPGAFFSERFCDLVAVFRTTPSWSAFAISGGRGLHWHFARPTV
ncbi:hypothetical protein SprV_0200873700 [Sparganum proliferum]